ncbi:UNVERIFIED_CONTAM: hypothetical protein PYX00_002229 [Menopon gallinae]|uniref:poly(ADP-ribose) glycohydrolase n=1 Tax=Menopon gallinae TaxID=328185 RepID=A0AAW2IFL9_9NEOP
MALVILPCDLPHWYSLQKELTLLLTATTPKQLIDGMLKIHNMCKYVRNRFSTSTGLDPDEPEKTDPTIFHKLENFVTGLSPEEQNHFFNHTLRIMAKRALDLKKQKPPNGFHFSLQQQADKMEYRRSFLASLLSHSFFSTFPKRTVKTHPTLQDVNFTHFFKHLDQPIQRAKLQSFFHYFDLIGESDTDQPDCVSFSRQVMSGKQWLTIEDWLDSCLPLCPITVRNEGRIEEAETQCLRICFSSSRIGGTVLCEGSSQECTEFCTVPELICILASVEALEDNEVLIVKDAYQVTKIVSPREKTYIEKFDKPNKVSICCMDPENYTRLPLSQLEEDNLLRELNKALLGFRQGVIVPQQNTPKSTKSATVQRRLSPIGESFSSTPEQSPINVSIFSSSQSYIMSILHQIFVKLPKQHLADNLLSGRKLHSLTSTCN